MRVNISYDCPEVGSKQSIEMNIEHGWYLRFELMSQLERVVKAAQARAKCFEKEYRLVYGKSLQKPKVEK